MKLIPKKSILLTGFTHRYLKDLDYDCTYSEGTLDITKFLSNLRNGYPHIMVGVEKGAYTGHAWL